MDKRLADCQRVIGYHFANPILLEIALTHSSLRTPDRECNERLEFLGDSVLGLVITEELYRLLPDQAEGELTRIKSAVVSRGALYRASTALGLARFAEFARGVGRRNELPVSVIANLVESVIGAIYLDAGYFPAREFVLRYLGPELDDVLNDRGARNHKSLLQHDAQQAIGSTPTYRTVEAEGPHHRKQFTVAALIRGQEWGRGTGATKKEAEQEAARKALAAWQRRGRGRRRRRGPKPSAAERGAPETARRTEEEVSSASAASTATPAPREVRGEGEPRRRRRRRGRAEAPPEVDLPSAEAEAEPVEIATDRPEEVERPQGEPSAAPAEEKKPRERRRRSAPRTRRTPTKAEDAAPLPRADAEAAPEPAPERVPEPKAKTEPEPAPVADEFAVGLDVPTASGRTRAKKVKKKPAARKPRTKRKVPDRAKAPPAASPPEEDGFDAGLDDAT